MDLTHAAPAAPIPQSASAAVADAAAAEAALLLEQLQEEIAHARRAPEPGMRKGDVLNLTLDVGGGLNVPLPQTATVDGEGYVWLYDTRTGEPSRCPANQSLLKQQIRKLRSKQEGGGRMFTTIPPDKWPNPPTIYVGTVKCHLHPADPDREEWNRLRFPVCQKANLATEHERDLHMASKHKREWASIKARRDRMEKEREWAWRERALAGALGPAVVAATAPAPAPEAPRPTRRPSGGHPPSAA